MPKTTHIGPASVTSLAQRLVQTPSLSTQEDQVAQILHDELEAVGLRDVHVDAMGNVIGWLGTKGPTLLLDGHMDTVAAGDPTCWNHDPFAGEIANGRLYGRGACDMKGGLAAMVGAARALVSIQDQLKGRVCVVFVVQEEPCEGMAIRHVIETEGVQPDWALICEPTNLQIARGHRGRIEIEVTVHGQGCHAANPHLGVNAIYEASRLIVGVELLAPQLGHDFFLGQGSIAVTEIGSVASSRNAIPETCTLYLDRRLTAGDTETKVLAELRRVLVREGVRADISVPAYVAKSYTGLRCEAPQIFPYWTTPEDHPLTHALAGAVDSSLGHLPRLTRWEFSTDGVYTAGVLGIPTIGYGPGDASLAHTADEHISVADIARAAEVYVALARRLLG